MATNSQTSGEITPAEEHGGGQRKPTIDAIHRDIALANEYRLELIKILLTIAAALFAFTVTFRPSLTKVDLGCAMWVGWAALGLSMIGGVNCTKAMRSVPGRSFLGKEKGIVSSCIILFLKPGVAEFVRLCVTCSRIFSFAMAPDAAM